MVKPVKKVISGWGNYPKESCYVYRPETMHDLETIVQNRDTTSQIVYGLGRSYGDTALNKDEGVIRFDQLNHMLGFDEEKQLLTCEAGVSLAEIIDVFLPRGYYLPVTPGTKYVTIGGAIANDVHGKNHHVDGCFSEFVVSFELLTAAGVVMTCSRNENADAFWATIGGIGLTGIILRATIQLIPVESSYINVTYEKAKNLDEAFEKFIENDKNYKYSVAWIDCLSSGDALGRSVLMRGEHAKQSELPLKMTKAYSTGKKFPLKMPINAPSFALNYSSISAFNKLYYASFSDGKKLVDQASFFHPLDAIGDWNKLYGKNGFVQYQAVFPKANHPKEGLRKLLERLSEEKQSSFLAVLKSSGPANNGLLSFPMEGYTLALDIPIKTNRLFPFLRELDEIVLSHGGRVYLAKDSTIGPDTFKQMYPNWEQFLHMKQQLDPEGRFSSSMSRRLGLT
ncbi:FAD-binding oxidoreductase [Lentibacillus sp. Marseille-P4043]|uniref:FAD-binding oxidoreductase n=1 Tax=Lentibacillus sp. Marseille-P4043 TaxID=2040293 RepID=UPI000D0B6598|nr:FAD-binding oxidoreductase [Lentibacillus sp. Marseille-P4043]